MAILGQVVFSLAVLQHKITSFI